MDIKLLGNRVIVKPEDPGEKKVGGGDISFSVAGKSEKEPERGLVVASGQKAFDPHYFAADPSSGGYAAPEAQPGDRILYERGEYREITIEGEKHFIIPGDAVIAIIK